jgi:hypothetical protein
MAKYAFAQRLPMICAISTGAEMQYPTMAGFSQTTFENRSHEFKE